LAEKFKKDMIKVRKEEDCYIISLYQIDKLNTLFIDSIEEQMENLVQQQNCKIYFDLSKIRFIDSAGFEMLKKTKNKADKNASQFILCNLSGEVKELIKLLNLENYFDTCERNIKQEMILVEVE
jgi:anti-anti-sigma factor